MLDQATLRSILCYDPQTGEFRYIKRWGHLAAGKKAGSLSNRGYINIMLKGGYYLAHRLAWLYVHGSWPKDQIDHINGNRTDNRICNLREADRFQNQWNARPKVGKYGRGVGFQYGKYVARIHRNGRLRHLGTFSDQKQAAAAYEAAARERAGEFFPEEAA